MTGTPEVGPPPSEIGRLPGAPGDNAIDAMVDFYSEEIFSDEDVVDDPVRDEVFLSVLEVVLAEGATVGVVNAAIKGRRGKNH